MNDLTNDEKNVLKSMILMTCTNRIIDDEYLRTLSTIYEKIFDASLKDDYMKWRHFNQNILNI